MKQIKELVENIRDEISGAEKYAKAATQYKDTERMLAETYAKMADAELGHVDVLHSQVVRIIREYKEQSKSEAPASMQAVWDWEHEHMIDSISRIKQLLSMYRAS